MKDLDIKTFPILAITGAAAVLIGGRTFHSFFGLGIMEGGAHRTYERASGDNRILSRIRKVEGVIIDEVSMISGEALAVAQALAQKAKGSKLPWGGIRLIAVGDFAQLPPITQNSQKRDWSFLSNAWKNTGFVNCMLSVNQRVQENAFLNVLNDVRIGEVSERVQSFLNEHVKPHDENDTGTRLFPRRNQADYYNTKKLNEIPQDEITVDSIYFGDAKYVETLKKNSPLPETLTIKIGARVMLIQNDPQRRWVNGSQGQIVSVELMKIVVKLDSGKKVGVEKSIFSMQDSEGNVLASILNFPMILAYATTIHKSQGATLDRLWVDLKSLWEPGQAYVALSRLRTSEGLNLISWSPRSVIVDPQVVEFYSHLKTN